MEKSDNSPLWLERTELLLGKEVLEKLRHCKVAIVGVGGVGAYAAEMIARSGVGKMVIVDSDKVSISNKNRQLLALDSNLDKAKVLAMASRLKDINSEIEVTPIEEFVTSENIDLLLPEGIDFLVDAIDTVAPKIALIRHCVKNKIPIVSSMGAGAKVDITKIKIADISKSFNCPLAFTIRKRLRKEGITKGFDVVFSEELPTREAIVPIPENEEHNKKSRVGTISYMPAVFGCLCAQSAIKYLLENFYF